MYTYLSIALGGALGSMARYATGVYVGRWLGTAFPWGTLLINIVGSFLIGAFAESFALRWDVSQSTRVFFVVGICGGYTTFSTFSLDIVTLINRGQMLSAGLYIVASVALGILALYGGLHAMRLILA
ncbi:MAG TPA: fluoride efflux transporter CrcB [Stellaceae bacterium]|jgi:CrcB protein|nr:fluoride efflux transporter CrcB [Stellaceae bacterium]